MVVQRAFVVTLVVLTFSIVMQASLMASGPSGEAMVYKEVDGKKLKLYVTLPANWKASQKNPTLVFFHGGGWSGGKPGQFTEHSKYFASRGMVAVQVQYRLITKGDTPKVCIQDAKSAIRWLRQHANDLGINTNRIASAGGSAGGHLAAFVGMSPGLDDLQDDLSVSAKTNAMILFNPVYDNGPKGYGNDRVGKDFALFSPFHQASKDDPPSIVFLGTADNLIPVATGEAFRDQLTKVGVRSELVLFDGRGHGFFNHGREGNVDYRKTIVDTDRFLVSLGWIGKREE